MAPSVRIMMRRMRGAVGMGLTWALVWALTGLTLGILSNILPGPWWDGFFSVFDAPLPALALPGFIGGACFSVVLGVAARHRRFDELSLARFGLWGALGGLALSLIPAALIGVGLASMGRSNVWAMTALIAGPLVVLSALSAMITLAVARRAGAEEPAPLPATEATPRLAPSQRAEWERSGAERAEPVDRGVRPD